MHHLCGWLLLLANVLQNDKAKFFFFGKSVWLELVLSTAVTRKQRPESSSITVRNSGLEADEVGQAWCVGTNTHTTRNH